MSFAQAPKSEEWEIVIVISLWSFFLGGGDGFVSRSLFLNFLFQKISNVQNSPKSTIVDIGADSSLFLL